MIHFVSTDDLAFRQQVEAGVFPIHEFNHRAHLRLAYVYLAEVTAEQAVQHMRQALLGLLQQAGIDPSVKFYETLTRAWVLAVHYFMGQTEQADSADSFIDQHPELLDTQIMLTHYSAAVLFSDQARQGFVEPDLDPIALAGNCV